MLKASSSLKYFYYTLLIMQAFSSYSFLKEKNCRYLFISTLCLIVSVYFFWFEMYTYDYHSKAAPFGINSATSGYILLFSGIIYLFVVLTYIYKKYLKTN